MRSIIRRRRFVAAVAFLLVPQVVDAYMAVLRQGTDTTEVANAGDAHGQAVATGDFNNDGFDDIAMAAPDESNSLINLAVHGGVVISYGSAAGLTHLGAGWITVGDVGTEDVRFGWSLVAADFDQDGFDDLAVGLPFGDLIAPTRTDAGQVWIYYGSAGGLQLAPGTFLDQTMVSGAAAEDNDLFGWSLTSGNFDSDIYPDLAVGAIGEDSDAGVAFYFYSDDTGVTTTGAGFVKLATLGDTSEANSWLGYAVEANDFDGNGFDDLAIGAPKKSVASLGTAGRVYIVFSTATGLNPSFVDTHDALSLGLVAESDAYFGWSLTSGNYWVDKASHDLGIGEPQFDHGGSIDAGRAIVLRFDPPPTKGSPPNGTTAGAAPTTPYVQMVPSDINILSQGANGNEQREAGDQFGYALASGQHTGDTLDEIAVAAPFEDITQPGLGNMLNSGALTIYTGRPSGPGAFLDTYRVLNVDTQNDHTRGGEKFGRALAFGNFDDSGLAALAIGAPGTDYEGYLDGDTDILDAGAVYISAPWRQPTSRPHRSSVVWDCDENIVYAQRPFDLVNPASTTKALTTLLACEAIEVNLVDENYVYTVDWARTPNINGSLVPLYLGEQMRFHHLMKTFMTRSGNDAGYALGDIMTGETAVWSNYTGTLPGFANIMNNKLTQLGISPATNMNNPSGMDYGTDPEHRTRAFDWVELAHDVMQNDCFREIVEEDCWIVPRNVPPWLLPWINGGAPLQMVFCNNFVNGLRSGGFPANGVKGGSTPSAWRTGLGSATALGGEVYAAWFGVRKANDPQGAQGGSNSGTGRDLLQVGRAACDLDVFAPPPPGPPDPFGTLSAVSTQTGSGEAMCMDLLDSVDGGNNPDDIELLVEAQVLGSPTANMRLAVDRTSNVTCAASETVAFNYEKIRSFEGMQIQNMGAATIDLDVSASHPTGVSWSFNIRPGDTADIPSVFVGGQDYVISLTNISSIAAADLGLHQLGMTLEATLGVAGPNAQSHSLTRAGGSFASDQMCVYFAGQDANAGTLVGISLHGAGVSTDILEETATPPPVSGLQLNAFPNPFNPSTTLRYYLPEAANIRMVVYDLAGRQLRVLDAGTHAEAGWHQLSWDGRDNTGSRLASGIYLVRLDAGSMSSSRRVVLLK